MVTQDGEKTKTAFIVGHLGFCECSRMAFGLTMPLAPSETCNLKSAGNPMDPYHVCQYIPIYRVNYIQDEYKFVNNITYCIIK